MTSYADLETALARLHGADAQIQRGAFRGRFKHLQRLGLPLGVKPGRGKRVEYGDEEIYQFVLAFELVQCGVDPTTIVKMIEMHWDSIFFNAMIEADRPDRKAGDRVLVLSVGMMSSAWEPEGQSLAGLRTANWISESTNLTISLRKEKRRALLINVSDALRQLRANLKELEGEK